MKQRAEQCCGNCAAFLRNRVSLTTPHQGECRPGPKTIIMVIQSMQTPQGPQMVQVPQGLWAGVLSNQWCLAWQDRETHPLFSGDGSERLTESSVG